MSLFLIDKEVAYEYETLLAQINESDIYCPLYKTDSLYEYLKNLIKALLSDQPLTLLDADLNLSEVDETKVNITVPIQKGRFDSMALLIDKIRNSSSEITLFTSGTTGQPKKVVHSVGTLTRTVRIGEKYRDQVWAFAYNPTHMAGLQVFFQAFQNQNTLVNLFNSERSFVYEAIERYHISHLSATPTFYRLLLPVDKTCETVVRITLGGEKSDMKLYESIRAIFPDAKINNVYASTEAGSLFAAKGEYFQIPVSISRQFRVEDEELLIHRSLLGKSDSFVFSGEYYKTGDLIEWIDQDQGIFRFKSRKNELINVGGYKVNPAEVESVILSIDGILQAVVYGKPNSVLGNVLCAEIKSDPAIQLTEAGIRSVLSSKMQDFKIPRRIKFVDSFSLTRTGKIKRT